MNLTNTLSQTHFILLIIMCILNEIAVGTRIPMEIVHHLQTSTTTQFAPNINVDSSKLKSHDNDRHTSDRIHNSESSSSVYDVWRERFRKERQLVDTKNAPRIFYQVGTSEDQLPICEANEVCSKIDLYGTPWIERQCRCPQSKHYHFIDHAINSNDNNDVLNTNNRRRYVFEHNLQLSDIGSAAEVYNFENEHIKSFLYKLGMFHNLDNDDDDDLMAEDYFSDVEHDDGMLKHNKFVKNVHNSIGGETMVETKAKIRHNGHGHSTQIGGARCSNAINTNDGYTIADKTRLYKICEPIHKLPLCRYFRDYTWTLVSYSERNITQQIVHCRCPKNSISYLIKREPLKTGALGYTYLFACSPQSRLKCQRKEPCKLFTVRKRQEMLDEVNTNSLCQCPRNHRCPRLHTDSGVVLGKSYIEDNIRTYSGYCMQQ